MTGAYRRNRGGWSFAPVWDRAAGRHPHDYGGLSRFGSEHFLRFCEAVFLAVFLCADTAAGLAFEAGFGALDAQAKRLALIAYPYEVFAVLPVVCFAANPLGTFGSCCGGLRSVLFP